MFYWCVELLLHDIGLPSNLEPPSVFLSHWCNLLAVAKLLDDLVQQIGQRVTLAPSERWALCHPCPHRVPWNSPAVRLLGVLRHVLVHHLLEVDRLANDLAGLERSGHRSPAGIAYIPRPLDMGRPNLGVFGIIP